MLEPDKRVVRFANTNEFIQLHLDRRGVPVLRILDQKHHQKSDDGCAGIDDKLPRVRETEHRTRNCPHNDYREGKGKDPGSTDFAGADLRDFSKQLAEYGRLRGRSGRGPDLFTEVSWH